MSADYDILTKEARLRGREGLFDLAVVDGRISHIAPHLNGQAATELSAGGNLVTESFVNPHLHLCKVYTRWMMDDLAMQAYHGSSMGRARGGQPGLA